MAILLPREDSSLVFLPPSPLPKALPAACRFLLLLILFSPRFSSYPSRAARTPQKPWLHNDRRSSDSDSKEFYARDGLRRDIRFDRIHLCLDWHSIPSVGDDTPTNRDVNPKCPPAVDYGVGPGEAPRPSSRGVDTPSRIIRPRPTPSTAATPAPAAYPVSTVPVPPDGDRTEPVGTPMVRPPFTPVDTPIAYEVRRPRRC